MSAAAMRPFDPHTVEELRALLAAGEATLLDPSFSTTLDTHLSAAYPWHGLRIGWESVPDSIQVSWDRIHSEKDIEDFVSATTLADHAFGCIVHNHQEPAILVAMKDAALLIDVLTPRPHTYLIVGADRLPDATLRLALDDFIQVDTVFGLAGRRRPDPSGIAGSP
jgi:hypothetical protein